METDKYITELYIVQYMVVHKAVGDDQLSVQPGTATRTRYPVTANQCLVYHLPPRIHCWPDTRPYYRVIGRGIE